MTPIMRYLEIDQLPIDPVEARRIRVCTARYTVMDGVLYRHGVSQPLLHCLGLEEANYILREMHEGIAGSHQGARTIARLAL